jgi:hypothetical protein
METSVSALQKKRGRPATGVDPMLNFRSPPELTARIEAWIGAQPDPKPSRSEAIRRLVEKALFYASFPDPPSPASRIRAKTATVLVLNQ